MKKYLLAMAVLPLFLMGVSLSASAQQTDESSLEALDRDLEAQWTFREVPAQSAQPLFTAAGRFELGVHLGYVAADDYYNYIPMGVDVHFRFDSYWGVMIRADLMMIHTDTKLSKFMDSHQTSVDVRMLGDEQLADIELLGTFHPLYGKWTAETVNLGRFDWGIYAGIGAAVSKSTNKTYTQRDTKVHAEGIVGTDFHFFILDWLAIRLDASFRFYKSPNQWILPCTISGGVSFFLPRILGE